MEEISPQEEREKTGRHCVVGRIGGNQQSKLTC